MEARIRQRSAWLWNKASSLIICATEMARKWRCLFNSDWLSGLFPGRCLVERFGNYKSTRPIFQVCICFVISLQTATGTGPLFEARNSWLDSPILSHVSSLFDQSHSDYMNTRKAMHQKSSCFFFTHDCFWARIAVRTYSCIASPLYPFDQMPPM